MFLSNCLLILDYESVFIQKNGEYAVHIPEMSMKKLIYFIVKENKETKNQAILETFSRKTSQQTTVPKPTNSNII